MKPYSNPSNCRRGARKRLGKNAKDGVDFTIEKSAGGWRWRQKVKHKPAKARAVRGKASPREAKQPGAWHEQLIDMLTRSQGATAAEVAKAFDWLEHTARARISTAPRQLNMRTVRTREIRKGEMVSVYRARKELIDLPRNQLGNLYEREEAA